MQLFSRMPPGPRARRKSWSVGSPLGGLAGLLLVALAAPVGAISFSWSDSIVGENSGFTTSGTADFTVDSTTSTLTITLTNTTSDLSLAIGEVLTALTWDISDPTVALSPVSALIASGSQLVGFGATSDTDLSTEWAFKDDLAAGSTALGPLGSYGISSVGDVNLGVDSFSPNDRFDTNGNLFPPPSGSLNGVEGGIVGGNVDFGSDGYTSKGPVVESQMVFTFDFTGDLQESDIGNVQPLFGTDGAPLIPEPGAVTLFATGLFVAGGLIRRSRRR
jgi:hypothetical protein